MDWSTKVVLITGGTGSFGKKCTAILLKECSPRKIIIFSRDELKQHEMRNALDHPSLRFFIGDVRDRERLYRALEGVQIVIHAAALKQVPAAEYNPFEAVKTNVIGAQNLIDAAIDRGVERVLGLSTDKAVNPVNLYGATKLCAEKLLIQGNSYSGRHGTRFGCVRYGNVVASRGSVIPLFQKQAESGVLTVTDKRMTRFWITLEQGVHLVLTAIERMSGGEIFVPKLPSMNILDLARALAPNARLETIGIRPGEKLHEVLIAEDEVRQVRETDNFYVILPHHPWWGERELPGARPVGPDFSYSSDTNPQRLEASELAAMIQRTGIEG
jgi:UDP-N-acetylglucosamine 4,6-dehydratase